MYKNNNTEKGRPITNTKPLFLPWFPQSFREDLQCPSTWLVELKDPQYLLLLWVHIHLTIANRKCNNDVITSGYKTKDIFLSQ